MARDHARIQLGIWNKDDFRALPASAQHTYLAIISAPRLSYCGVLDYIPGRLAALSKGTSASKVEASVKVLEAARFVIVDRTTSELAVRTYVRHDGVLQRTNMGKAMGRALEKVVSDRIRNAIYKELRRYYKENPDLAGWDGFANVTPDAFTAALGIPSPMASAMPSPMESPSPSPMEVATPLPPTPYPALVKSVSQPTSVARGVDDDGLTRIQQALNNCPQAHARKTADFVLAKAPDNVRNPVAYILKAISEEPDAYRYKRGNPKKADECPTHAGQWADACAGCAADRKAAS